MVKNSFNKELLQKIDPITTRKYANLLGWKKIDKEFEKYMLLSNSAYPEEQLLIPLNSNLADYHIRIRELIEVLSSAIGKTQEEILNDLIEELQAKLKTKSKVR